MPNALWWSSSQTDTSHASPSGTAALSTVPITITQPSTTFLTSTIGPVRSNPTATLPYTVTNTPTVSLSSITTSNTLPISNSNPSSSPSGFSTTFISITVTLDSTTFVSSSASLIPANLPTNGVGDVGALSDGLVCIGQGIDVTATGVIASTVLSSLVGLLLWLLFAYLRPKFRQVYSVREWFVTPGLRPKPLSKTFWAFLWPHVPLVPSVPKDVSSYSNGRKPQTDATLFPSDDELAQRTIWHAFLLVLAWSVIGLGGALPLYLVDTPCVANSTPASKFGGTYSTLEDLSLLRLLNMIGHTNIGNTPGSVGQFPSNNLSRRATVDGKDVTRNVEVRLIVLAVLVVAVAAIPAVYKLLHEFTRLVNYRRRWIEVRCGGIEMGWLSRKHAPGFDGWGENQLKEFLIKSGLSKGFGNSGVREGFAGVGANGRNAGEEFNGHTVQDESPSQEGETRAQSEVDLQGLFTVADTTRLSVLVNERDIILNNLEVAETRYINSFRLSTPLPSVVDFEVPEEPSQLESAPTSSLKKSISRPRALSGSSSSRVRHKRRKHPYIPGAAPTSYVAPSSYYKLRDVRGIGRMSTSSAEDSLTQRIGQRVIGSRFQEIHRDSFAFGRIPLGSHVQLDDRTGTLRPVRFSEEQLQHGPNDPSSGNELDTEAFSGHPNSYGRSPDSYFRETSGDEYSPEPGPSTVHEEDEWTPIDSNEMGVHPRPPKQWTPPPPERRSTFAMRSKTTPTHADAGAVPPPHLRLQPRQPFVRPVSGMDHDDLGVVYSDISLWRSRLKAINAEITEAQAENYNYIADGVNVKGWLLVGRGLRFLPGVQVVEGRSKEDIRYGELQVDDGFMSNIAFWIVVAMVALLLGASLVAVSGLVMAPAPDVDHYLTFLQPLSQNNGIGAALATTLAPAVAASFFIALALCAVHYAARFSGSVSVTSARITAFKAAFFVLTAVCCIWLIACGSTVFALEAFATSTQRTQTVASGSIYFAAFLLVLIINVAIISPAILMLQPLRLWRIIRHERNSVTPRQQFRAVYPRSYDPTYGTACCLVAFTFAATFSLIFPLIGPAVCLLLLLTLIAHRYLIGYVYARTDAGHTGGLLQIWLLRRFADLVALQPLLLGLILLTRQQWALGGILLGAAIVIMLVVEGYAWFKLRLPGVNSLDVDTRNSLADFKQAALPEKVQPPSKDPSFVNSLSHRGAIPRNSMASVLEMMSLTLAVMPSKTKSRGPVPLQTEDLDDLTATEQAARTNPNAPPHLPPLPFTTHHEEMHGILYSPELIAPPPVIWLPNDRSGVAQSEAVDLFRYHDLKTTLDVSPYDAISRQRDVFTTS